MSPITIKESSNKTFAEGWHTVTIREAQLGDFNGSKFIDLWFTDYPDSLKCRVWEARNKDGEEFSVTNMIRYSNPEILEELPEKDGAAVAKLDDSPASLIGKGFQVLFYKNANGYTEVSQKVAPATEFENIIDKMTEQRIEGIKTSAEKYVANRAAATATKSTDSDAIADPF